MPNQKLLTYRGSAHVQKHVEKHDSEENELQFCEDQDAPELFNTTSGFLANDEVPETLIPALKILADDFVPETLAAADFIDRWLAERQPDPGAVAVGRLAEALGMADFICAGRDNHGAGATASILFTATRSGSLYYTIRSEADRSQSIAGGMWHGEASDCSAQSPHGTVR